MSSQFKKNEELGKAAILRDDLKEAKKHFRNMVKESRKHSEKDQASALQLLGDVCLREEKYDETEETLKKSVELHKSAFGENAPETALAQCNLATGLWLGNKNRNDARSLLEHSVEKLQSKMGSSDKYDSVQLDSFANAFESLATLKEGDKDYAGAETLFRIALELLLKSSDGKLTENVIHTLYYLTGVLQAQSKETEAHELLAQHIPHLKRLAADRGSSLINGLIEEYERELLMSIPTPV
ncbi:MAG TPA: tetratricopeptide repeat protein [Planktothrix sp.]|jgi:glutamate mutase epsilon subunit